jgi:putative SOS response-associated peptidase YedK
MIGAFPLAVGRSRPYLCATCGRYASFLPPEAIAAMFHTVNPLPNIAPTWNLAPTEDALVVRRHPGTGERHLDVLNWGFLPYWTKGDPKKARRPISAKAETVATSGMFRDAFARRRALIPAAAFYEWRAIEGEKTKQPFAIARQDGDPLALAGIWDGWRGEGGQVVRSFAIITTNANQLMAHAHNRMPVIVEQADLPIWLGETEGDLAGLLRPAGADVLGLWTVSRAINNVRNDGPELLDAA